MQKIVSPKQLSENQLILFENEYNEKRKYPVTAWLLAIFLGEFGAHRFYLGDTKGGLLRLLVPVGLIIVTSVSYLIGVILPMLIIVVYAFKIFDWFLLPKLIYRVNKKIELRALAKFNVIN